MASSQPSLVTVPQSSYAGLGRRIAAYLIDVLIAIALLFVVGFLMRGLRAAGVWTPAEVLDPSVAWREMAVPAKIAILVAFVVSMGPFCLAFFEASAWQASVGKRLLNIYVTDGAGRRLGLVRSLGRSFAKCFFNLFYLVLASVVTIAASAKKQALHDFAAKTLVMRGQPEPGGSLEPWQILAAFGIPFFWLVVTFVAVFQTVG